MRTTWIAIGVALGAAACSGSSGSSSSSSGGASSSGTASSGTIGGTGTSSGTASSSSGVTGGTGGMLTGAAAFTVADAATSHTLSQCNSCIADADGGAPSTVIFLSDHAIAADACTSTLVDAGATVFHVIRIDVAAPNYVACAGGTGATLPAALAAGMYPILDEGVSDEDVCGNIPASDTQALAIFQYEECSSSACQAEYWASGGSVTLSSASVGEVAGTFDVTLTNPDMGIADAGELSGTFSALGCP